MVATSLVLVPVAVMGWVYAVTAVLAGGLFLVEAHRLLRAAKGGAAGPALKPMRLFHYSITYVTVRVPRGGRRPAAPRRHRLSRQVASAAVGPDEHGE